MDLLITFNNSHEAMLSEELVKQANIKARLIPLPEAVAEGCGLAMKIEKTRFEEMKKLFKENYLKIREVYEIEESFGKKAYKCIYQMD